MHFTPKLISLGLFLPIMYQVYLVGVSRKPEYTEAHLQCENGSGPLLFAILEYTHGAAISAADGRQIHPIEAVHNGTRISLNPQSRDFRTLFDRHVPSFESGKGEPLKVRELEDIIHLIAPQMAH